MTRDASRSQTDFDVLKSSQRGKVVAIVGALAVLSGLWWVTRGGPIGEPEHGDSVLLIRNGPVSQRHVLREYGFRIAEADFADATSKAKEELPEFEGEDVAAIMQLADLKGFGYVAFENPEDVDFSALEFAEPVPKLDDAGWAVVSAGDYAFPHHMTLPPVAERVLRGHELDLLQALFAQEPLASARDEAATKPQEIFVLRTSLRGALERLKDIDLAVETIAKIHADTRKQLVDAETVEPKPELLGTSEESVKPFALADGGILTILRRASFSSYTGVTADIDLESTFRFFYHPPGSFDPEQRVECTSILGGQLEQTSRRPRFRMAAAGDALLIDDRHDPHLWVLDKNGACSFKDLGSVGYPSGDRKNLGVPHHSGAVARVRSDGNGGAVLEVITPGGQPEEVFSSDKLALGQPVWLDDRHLALRANLENRAATDILFVSRDRHDQQLWLKTEVPGIEDSTVVELAARPGASDTQLVAVIDSRSASTQLVSIKLSGNLAERFAALAVPDPLAAAAEVVPREPMGVDELLNQTVEQSEANDLARQVALLKTAGVSMVPGVDASYQRLYEDGGLRHPSVSLDGQKVAFLVYGQGSGTEIAVTGLDGSAPVVLTGNNVDDHTPTVTADGSHAVFHSRYKLRNTTWTLTAGRTVKLP